MDTKNSLTNKKVSTTTPFYQIIRKNIGLIVAIIGILLVTILTFGDLGDFFTEEYWKNVGGNFTSISFLTVGFVMIQVVIKQAIGEHALSKGLNTERTIAKYTEHRELLKSATPKMLYVTYFLTARNERITRLRRQEFLFDNNFVTEKVLYESGNKKAIKLYEKIQTNLTLDSIKWSTTDIQYTKNGRIEKLGAYRQKRFIHATIQALICMVATVFIAGGLFAKSNADTALWQKFVKLFVYILSIAFGSVFDIGKNYEKGAIGVPNELEEINLIWQEFLEWEIPQWVIEDIKKSEQEKHIGNNAQEQDTVEESIVIEEIPIEEETSEIELNNEEKSYTPNIIYLGYNKGEEYEE